MSLVDYSSDEDDDDERHGSESEERKEKKPQRSSFDGSSLSSSTTLPASVRALNPGTDVSSSSEDAVEARRVRLPDASELLASFDSGQVPEASFSFGPSTSMGTSGSRKRPELNGSLDAIPKKLSKGALDPSRVIPDTLSGTLLPPQLRGRSNVATEDLEKLFTRRQEKR